MTPCGGFRTSHCLHVCLLLRVPAVALSVPARLFIRVQLHVHCRCDSNIRADHKHISLQNSPPVSHFIGKLDSSDSVLRDLDLVEFQISLQNNTFVGGRSAENLDCNAAPRMAAPCGRHGARKHSGVIRFRVSPENGEIRKTLSIIVGLTHGLGTSFSIEKVRRKRKGQI